MILPGAWRPLPQVGLQATFANGRAQLAFFWGNKHPTEALQHLVVAPHPSASIAFTPGPVPAQVAAKKQEQARTGILNPTCMGSSGFMSVWGGRPISTTRRAHVGGGQLGPSMSWQARDRCVQVSGGRCGSRRLHLQTFGHTCCCLAMTAPKVVRLSQIVRADMPWPTI